MEISRSKPNSVLSQELTKTTVLCNVWTSLKFIYTLPVDIYTLKNPKCRCFSAFLDQKRTKHHLSTASTAIYYKLSENFQSKKRKGKL